MSAEVFTVRKGYFGLRRPAAVMAFMTVTATPWSETGQSPQKKFEKFYKHDVVTILCFLCATMYDLTCSR